MKESIIILIVVLLILVPIMNMTHNNNIREIEGKVNLINGEVLSIESKSWIGKNPFKWNTKDVRIYRFEYELNSKAKIGWVRFKLFKNDWIMDWAE